jgi:hypothetical protein
MRWRVSTNGQVGTSVKKGVFRISTGSDRVIIGWMMILLFQQTLQSLPEPNNAIFSRSLGFVSS